MSLNALVNACNQVSNRDPVTGYSGREVENGVDALRDRQLATMVMTAGGRTQKYRHNLLDHYELSGEESGLLTVLLLRGPQTPGELRQRVERLAPISLLEEVEQLLDGLMAGSDPLVAVLPAGAGQKERRYIELLSERADPAEAEVAVRSPAATVAPSRSDSLEEEVRRLRQELDQLKSDFLAFRGQF